MLQLYLLPFEPLLATVTALGHPTHWWYRRQWDQTKSLRPDGHAQDQVPQEAADLRRAQAAARPRDYLKAGRLCVSGLFFEVWRSSLAAHTTASRASVT